MTTRFGQHSGCPLLGWSVGNVHSNSNVFLPSRKDVQMSRLQYYLSSRLAGIGIFVWQKVLGRTTAKASALPLNLIRFLAVMFACVWVIFWGYLAILVEEKYRLTYRGEEHPLELLCIAMLFLGLLPILSAFLLKDTDNEAEEAKNGGDSKRQLLNANVNLPPRSSDKSDGHNAEFDGDCLNGDRRSGEQLDPQNTVVGKTSKPDDISRYGIPFWIIVAATTAVLLFALRFLIPEPYKILYTITIIGFTICGSGILVTVYPSISNRR